MIVVIDCRMIQSSGIGVYLRNIIVHLWADKSLELSFIVNRDQETLIKDITAEDAEIIYFNSKPFSLKEQVEFFFKMKKCDVLWIPHINIPIISFKARKLVVTIHDVFHLANPNYYSWVAITFFKGLFVLIRMLADLVITVSDFSKSEIVKYTGIQPAGIYVIKNAVTYLDNEASIQDTTYEIMDYLLYVGNVKPHKNVQLLLKAFNAIKDEFPDLVLVVVGKKDGFYRGLNDFSTFDLTRIVFTGFVSDATLNNIYKNARLFILPSSYEGFGLPILEAMQYNIPILASNIPPFKEIAKNKIEYFDLADDKSLVVELRKILNSTVTLRPNYYVELLESYSWSKSAEKHAELFKRTLDENFTIR